MQQIISHFQKNDHIIAQILLKMDMAPLLAVEPDQYFSRLTRTIVGQQLSVKAASTIYARFKQLFDEELVSPQLLINIDDQALRDVGISWSKIKYLKDLADKTISGELPFTKFSLSSEQEIIDQLITVKGIGQWSAEMFLMFTMGREDVFSFVDLGLKTAIANLYGMKRDDIESMKPLVDRWKPYRTYAALALWHSLDNEPKK